MKLIKRNPDLGYIDTMLWVPKKLLNVDGVKRALEFELTDRDSIRVLRLWEEAEHHLIVPRAFWKPGELAFDCIDCRPTSYARTGVQSKVKLDYKPINGKLQPTGDTVQATAIEALLEANGGILQLACGKGKTVVALHLASLLQVPTLIVVDNTHLLQQWQAEIGLHLNVPGGVGLIQGAAKDWQRGIVVGTYQSLANWAEKMPEEVRRWFGLIVWDEGHHVSAPTFQKSAPLFYGYRLSLTATPKRQDGTHVIAEHHIGEIIFKDLIQKSPPKIYFKWTGFELDFDDAKTRTDVCDKNGEVHLGKLAGYFGANRHRLNDIVIPEVKALVDAGHKAIVLSNSVDEVINLHAIWTTGDPNVELYTDIPYPTNVDVGETLLPCELKKDQINRALRFIADIKKNLDNNPDMQKSKREVAEERLKKYEELLAQFEVWKKTEKEMRRRQRQYLKDLLKLKSTSGIFTEAVEPSERFEMLRTRQVIFAIMKYGREGLDDKKLSAVLVSEPISDRNTLQQIMGRPRDKSNSVLIFLEDNIGPLIGQCRKLRHHLRDWPVDEGGPFKYEQLNHPSVARRQGSTWNQKLLLRKPGLRASG